MYPKTYFDLFPPFPRTNRVFVAMSFDTAFDPRWDNVIYPAISSVRINDEPLEPYRVDTRVVSDSILTDIEEGIATSRLVFIDLTTIGYIGTTAIRNGNVLYEMGMAHSIRLPEEVLIFRSDADPLPFDTANLRVNDYEPDGDVKGPAIEKVKNSVMDLLREVELVKHKTVEGISRKLDVTAYLALMAASSPNGLKPTPRKTAPEIIGNVAHVASVNKLLDNDLVMSDVVVGTLNKEDPNKVGAHDFFDRIMQYRITPLGNAVLARLGESILPHFPNLIADFEEALRKEAEEQETNGEKGD